MRLALMGLLLLCLPLAAQVQVLEQNDAGLKLHIDVSDAVLTDSGEWAVLGGMALERPDASGMPDLPYIQTLVAVPPGGGATATAEMSRASTQKLSAPLRPVPTVHTPAIDGVDQVEYRMSERYAERAAAPIVEVLPAYEWRDYTLVPVRIRPFSYDADSKSLTRRDNLTINISIHGDKSFRGVPTQGMASAAEQAILNWETASGWRNPTRVEVNYADFNAWPAWVKIEIAEDGMYELTYGDISGKLDLSLVDPAEFRLFSTGGAVFPFSPGSPGLPFAEVPILVEGHEDGRFDSGDRILFYGRCRDGYGRNDAADQQPPLWHNPYSRTNCYWLTYGAGDTAPKRISTMPTQTYGVTRQDEREMVLIEEEKYRRVDFGFEWFMTNMQYMGNLTTSYDFTFSAVDVIDNQQQQVTITVQEEVYTGDPRDHHLVVAVNNHSVIDEEWEGTAYKTFYDTGEFLRDGTNNLRVTLARSNTYNMYLDNIRVEYNRRLTKHSYASSFQVRDADDGDMVRYVYADGYSTDLRAFVVNDFDDVTMATISPSSDGFSFTCAGDADDYVWVVDGNDYESPASVSTVQPNDLTLPSIGAEAIIVAPQTFLDEANELAQTYESTLGLQTFVADLDDVFEQFSGGNPDPAAIRGLVRWVYGSDDNRSLGYLTLLGAGVSDWRNFSNANTGKDHVIIWQESSTSSDDYFGYIGSDNAPVLGIGRYPAWNSTDLRNQLDHTIERLQDPEHGWWTNRLLFVADDEHNSGQHNQEEHTNNAQANSRIISRSVVVDKIMAIDYELDAFQNKPQVRDLIIDEVKKGALVWFYTGHGGPTKIGDEDYFTTSDLSRLDNGVRKMPLFIAASCSVGKYDLWGVRSLAEAMVTQKNSGAIGAMGASCGTFGGSNLNYFNFVFDEIINHRLTMGPGLVAAKLRTSSNVREQYIYFGDPTLSIVPPAYVENIQLANNADSVYTLQVTSFDGAFPATCEGEAEARVYDAEVGRSVELSPGHIARWTERGDVMFRGMVSTAGGAFDGEFIAPYDIEGGDDGRIIVLHQGEDADQISFLAPLTVAPTDVVPANPDAPHIELWLDNKWFIEGDPVGSSPTLIAALSDSSSINMLGKPGHKILARVMSEEEFYDVTDSFVFDLDTPYSGELNWQFEGLSTGPDSVEVIAFDTQNRASVAHLGFTVSSGGGQSGVAIEDMLPYPNPLNKSNDFYFTFILTRPADIRIDIYTITGRKIQTIEHPAASGGYTQVAWDGRDADGDEVANNTYFYRVKAKGLDGGDAEEIGKVMVLR